MQLFNINNVITTYGLDKNELAKVLFPEAKYPMLALSRVLKGKADLSVKQLELTAAFIGIEVAKLFDLRAEDNWQTATKDGVLTFKKGIYTVKVNYQGSFITLYKNDKVTARVINSNSMTLQDFFKFIDNLILTN